MAGFWNRVTGGEQWRTWPNLVSAGRIALLPLLASLLISHAFTAATCVAVVVFASDALDGYLARRLHQSSLLGRLLDPAADRATVLVLIVGLGVAGLLPTAVAVLAIVPDAFQLVAAFAIFRGAPDIPVVWLGKLRTALQFGAFSVLLLAASLQEHGIVTSLNAIGALLACAAVLTSFLAGSYYSVRAGKLLAAA